METGRAIKALAQNQIAMAILDTGQYKRGGPLRNFITKGAAPAGNLIVADFPVYSARCLGLPEVHLAIIPHPSVLEYERYYGDVNLHGIKVNMHEIANFPGNLRVIQSLFERNGGMLSSVQTIIIAFADDVNNIPLLPLLDEHLRCGAGVSVAVQRMPRIHPDWNSRTFATFRLKGMPERKDFQSDAAFREAREKTLPSPGSVTQVEEVCEQEEDPNHRTHTSESDLACCGLMLIETKFWKDRISGRLSDNFWDAGHHLYPFLASSKNTDFSAYVIPKVDDKGVEVFSYDIASPRALLDLNHYIAGGLIDTRVREPNCKFWTKMEPYGYKGTSNVVLCNEKVLAPYLEFPRPIGPLIESHTGILGTTMDTLTVVRGHSRIEATTLEGCLVFGGTPKGIVDLEGINAKNCIFVGPVGIRRKHPGGRAGLLRLGEDSSFENLILFWHNLRNPDVWAWDYLDGPFDYPSGLNINTYSPSDADE